MIGFQMNNNLPENDKKSSNTDEKEMPVKKPEIEITNPSPSVIPTPPPDQIRSIPKPEIIDSPLESPSTDITEVGGLDIVEF